MSCKSTDIKRTEIDFLFNNFNCKPTRGCISGESPITYNEATGVIGIDVSLLPDMDNQTLSTTAPTTISISGGNSIDIDSLVKAGETDTTLDTPTYDAPTNVLSIKYTGEDGVQQIQTVDLTDLEFDCGDITIRDEHNTSVSACDWSLHRTLYITGNQIAVSNMDSDEGGINAWTTHHTRTVLSGANITSTAQYGVAGFGTGLTHQGKRGGTLFGSDSLTTRDDAVTLNGYQVNNYGRKSFTANSGQVEIADAGTVSDYNTVIGSYIIDVVGTGSGAFNSTNGVVQNGSSYSGYIFNRGKSGANASVIDNSDEAVHLATGGNNHSLNNSNTSLITASESSTLDGATRSVILANNGSAVGGIWLGAGQAEAILGATFRSIIDVGGYRSISLGGADNYQNKQNTAIIVGLRNINRTKNSIIAGGQDNLSSSTGSSSAIIGANNGLISGGSNNSGIYSGIQGSIGSHRSVIVGGQQGEIQGNQKDGVVLGGLRNKLITNTAIGDGGQSAIVGGFDNVVGSMRSATLGGVRLNIGTSNNNSESVIIGGKDITFDGARISSAGGGENNLVTHTFGSSMYGGADNVIDGTYSGSPYGYIGIFNGYKGRIDGVIGSPAYSTIVGGDNNYVSNFATATVAGRNLTLTGALSLMGGGLDNILSGTRSGMIGGRNLNDSSDDSFMAGGQNNTINSSGQRHTILGGTNNLITGAVSDTGIYTSRSSTIDGASGFRRLNTIIASDAGNITNASNSSLLGTGNCTIAPTGTQTQIHSQGIVGSYNCSLGTGFAGFIGGSNGCYVESITSGVVGISITGSKTSYIRASGTSSITASEACFIDADGVSAPGGDCHINSSTTCQIGPSIGATLRRNNITSSDNSRIYEGAGQSSITSSIGAKIWRRGDLTKRIVQSGSLIATSFGSEIVGLVAGTATSMAVGIAAAGALVQSSNQLVTGRYNVGQGTSEGNASVTGDFNFIIGNGTNNAARSNSFAVSNEGAVQMSDNGADPVLTDATMGQLFIKNGALYYKGTSGTVTMVAAA